VRLKVVKAHNGATLALAPVFIRGKGPFIFAVDTGASQSVVDSSLVKRLHLQQGRSETVTGISCSSNVLEVKVQHWSVGRVDLPARMVASTNLPGKGSNGLQGLLGSDILSQFGAITLDYKHQMLVVHAR
jgi:hypothetical protein